MADPPPGALATGPIPDWFHSLRVPADGPGYYAGSLCCSVADCRRVRAEFRDDGYWWVYIDSITFPDDDNRYHGHAPNDWVQVPESAVLPREDNPAGGAIACWYAGQLRCFVKYIAS